MALIWADSFAYYDQNTIGMIPGYGASSATIGSTLGRFGTGGVLMSVAYGTIGLVKTFPTTYSTLIIGCAYRPDSVNGTRAQLVQFYNTGAGGDQTPCGGVTFNVNGQLYIFDRYGTVKATDTFVAPWGIWFYYEIKATFSSTTGSIYVRRDGLDVLSATGFNNSDAYGHTYADRFNIGGGSYSIVQLSDLYVCDTSGSRNNDFLGDVRVLNVKPAVDGANTAWSPNTGTTHYTQVDDLAPDGNTSYVYASSVGAVDTYEVGALPISSGTVAGVVTRLNAEKVTGGTRTVAPVIRMGSTDYVGTAQAVGMGYNYFQQIYETRPSDSGTWTITDVNDMELGAKVVS